MTKPYGIGLGVSNGACSFYVTRSSRAEDKIWDAAQEAHSAGMTFKQFIEEAREAYKQLLSDEIKTIDRLEVKP